MLPSAGRRVRRGPAVARPPARPVGIFRADRTRTLTCRIIPMQCNAGEQQVKALAWHGKGDIRCDDVPDPKIEHPRDAVIKVTACAICGSDLHIYGGIIPAMKKGDVLGHENMGEVVEVGPGNKALKV